MHISRYADRPWISSAEVQQTIEMAVNRAKERPLEPRSTKTASVIHDHNPNHYHNNNIMATKANRFEANGSGQTNCILDVSNKEIHIKSAIIYTCACVCVYIIVGLRQY
jgi:hypothetical protein